MKVYDMINDTIVSVSVTDEATHNVSVVDERTHVVTTSSTSLSYNIVSSRSSSLSYGTCTIISRSQRLKILRLKRFKLLSYYFLTTIVSRIDFLKATRTEKFKER